MPNPVSPELLAKLRAAEGEGLSRDPKNNPRKTIKLLTDKDDELKPGSNWYREGARAGQYLIGDRLCDNFILTPILYLDAYVEWKPDRGGVVDTHSVLPEETNEGLWTLLSSEEKKVAFDIYDALNA